MMVPEGTLSMIDTTMGAMIKGMAQAFGGPKDIPGSVAEEMFWSKDEIFKKAQKAGFAITFESYNRSVKDKNLYVDYKISFDDVNKLLQSGLLVTQLGLGRNDQGQIVAFLKKNQKKAEESRGKVALGSMGEAMKPKDGKSETPQQKNMREKFTKALSQFAVEFRLTMPNSITSASGLFTKEDEKTVVLAFKGDLNQDPGLLDKFYGIGEGESQVVSSSEGVTFQLPSLTEAMKDGDQAEAVSSPDAGSPMKAPGTPSAKGEVLSENVPEKKKDTYENIPIGSEVKVTMRDGEVVEGKLVERANDYIRVDCGVGLALTYLKELIWKMEIAGGNDVKSK
jgi:hypothetical protein